MKQLKIATELSLPLDLVTQAIAILAKRRAGKSFTARRFVEQLHKAGQQVVVVDPKGDWYGIRASADGKKPGLPIVMFGGERGDVPLEVGSGEIVAQLVVEERMSVLLDLSLLRKHEVATFMTAFLETFYRLKATEKFRTPVMLMIDEADAIAPQEPEKNETRMLGAAEDIVRRGGQRGIGCTLITQRTAVLNKNVLTQCEMIVALRTIAPQDLKAMNAWIDVHGTVEQRATLMSSLPALPTGDAWFWSPGWPTGDGIFQRVHVLPIETFDSGATPKPGETRTEPKTLADVDLAAVRKLMSETIERAQADDPKLLRARISGLEARLKLAEKKIPADKIVVEVPVVPPETVRALKQSTKWAQDLGERLQKSIAGLTGMGASLEGLASGLLAAADGLAAKPAPLGAALSFAPRPAAPGKAGSSLRAPRGSAEAPVGTANVKGSVPTVAPRNYFLGAAQTSVVLPKGVRAILTAIAQNMPDGATREQLMVLTCYRRSSMNTYLQQLAQAGRIEDRAERIFITEKGHADLGAFEALPTGEALRLYWLGELPQGERAIFEVVMAAYPEAIERTSIDAATGYKPSSRNTYLQKLSARRLIESVGTAVQASAVLFKSA